jgi:hypothetical protein
MRRGFDAEWMDRLEQKLGYHPTRAEVLQAMRDGDPEPSDVEPGARVERYEPIPRAGTFHVLQEGDRVEVFGLWADEVGLHGDGRGFHVSILEGSGAGYRIGPPWRDLAPAYRFLREVARMFHSWKRQGRHIVTIQGTMFTQPALEALTEIRSDVQEAFYGTD